MKKSIFKGLLIAVFFGVLSTTAFTQSSKLVGTWCDDGEDDTGICLTFDSRGNVSLFGVWEEAKGTYKLNGDSIEIFFKKFRANGTINGNKITLDYYSSDGKKDDKPWILTKEK